MICNDYPIDDQVYCRTFNFIRSAAKSENELIRICANMAINGSRSVMSNNINILCEYQPINKYLIPETMYIKRELHTSINASVIRDIMLWSMALRCDHNTIISS